MILKSINYWSMSGGLDGTLDVSTFLKTANKYGYDAVELCIGESGALGLDVTEARCKEIVAEAENPVMLYSIGKVDGAEYGVWPVLGARPGRR